MSLPNVLRDVIARNQSPTIFHTLDSFFIRPIQAKIWKEKKKEQWGKIAIPVRTENLGTKKGAIYTRSVYNIGKVCRKFVFIERR